MAHLAAACPAPTTDEAGGLLALDALARDRTARGLHTVRGPRSALDAAARHVARRARAIGRPLLSASRAAASCPWRDLAIRCGVLTADPLAAAQEILAAAGGAILLVAEGAATAWGRAVAEEVACLAASGAGAALVIALSDAAPKAWETSISIGGTLSAAELRVWWEAAAEDAGRRLGSKLDRIEALEGWWSAAIATPLDERSEPPALGAAARRLLDRICASQRPWKRAQLDRLGPSDAADELLALGLITADDRGWITASGAGAPAPAPEPSADVRGSGAPDGARPDLMVVAEALEQMPADPWAWARASELFAALGLADRAEAAAIRAIGAVGDVTARADFCRRWGRSIDVLPRESSGARLLRSADLSLRAGDVERAIEFARAAVAREGESCDALLALGRATTARGDLTTAAIVLGKAMAAAPDAASRARASVELAEVRYKSGEQADAKRLAAEALAAAPDLAARLGARNVLGKLLLASGAWAEAEEHFAADAWEAACGGDRVGELRAQLNRAIALLSSGRLDEARSMLHGVLEDGEACSELRASGLALSNLSVIALLKHEYLDAVRLAERALEVFRLMGEKATLAHLITNLAELRLQIGLVVEAEQALAFGRKVCGPVIPGTRAPHLSLVAAQIHLARGRTMDAAAEVSSAIASASGSSNGAKLGECYAVAARIALEDGHLARAEQAIARARAEASSARAQAEVALLEAMLARAGGAPFEAAAQRGLDLAREADDSERLREAHALLHVAAADAGDARAARYHLDAALALRDRVAASLPEELRLRFLARRDVEALARLEAQARRDADAARPCELCGEAGCRACGRPSAPSLPSRRAADSMFGAPGRAAEPRVPCAPGLAAPASSRIIGRDAAVRALLSLIQKVGASDATVLIHGESGTGKELVAEAIHEASPRRHGPLVKVNCSALVETLLLSELFGHEKGSFTGAAARRRGRFEVAEGGTIFLDEIGDISPRTQVALLRVLEDRTFERVGGVTPLRANVRILCATHRDLRAMVARGEFREDLYYRLRQVVLEVPALRQRIGDLPQIAAAILARIAADLGTAPKRLSGRAATALSRHAWPGNVRELENALRAAALFAEGETIEVEHFASNVDGFEWLAASEPTPSDPGRPPSSAPSARGSAPPASGAGAADDGDRRTPVEVAYAQVRAGTSLSDMKREIERECIARALEESRGNITRAAALLGMKRPRLSQLVKQYGFGGVSED